MEFIELELPGLVEIRPKVLQDSRGYFFESYRQDAFAQHGIPTGFVQDNQSFSTAGVLRGLHFQNPPHDQGKLVRVVWGRGLDVVVDIRKGSPTFGQHLKLLLEAEKGTMLWVPPGFAHGFVALEDTVFTYKCTHLYNRQAEGGIFWADPDLGIDWEATNPNISEKDQVLPRLKDISLHFDYN